MILSLEPPCGEPPRIDHRLLGATLARIQRRSFHPRPWQQRATLNLLTTVRMRGRCRRLLVSSPLRGSEMTHACVPWNQKRLSCRTPYDHGDNCDDDLAVCGTRFAASNDPNAMQTSGVSNCVPSSDGKCCFLLFGLFHCRHTSQSRAQLDVQMCTNDAKALGYELSRDVSHPTAVQQEPAATQKIEPQAETIQAAQGLSVG